jgi:hypothetical protein
LSAGLAFPDPAHPERPRRFNEDGRCFGAPQ